MREVLGAALLAGFAVLSTQPGCSGGDGIDCTPSVEVCDGLDNDCDGVVDPGCCSVGVAEVCFTGPAEARGVGTCQDGLRTCLEGGVWGECLGERLPAEEACDGLAADEDCDGLVDDGFVGDGNPGCSPLSLGWVSGDTDGSGRIHEIGYGERWYSVTITENNADLFGRELHAVVDLYSPPGVDFDLKVFCDVCGGVLVNESSGSSRGSWDQVDVWANDKWGSTDTFAVVIKIEHYSTTVCAPWSLDIVGNRELVSGPYTNPCR